MDLGMMEIVMLVIIALLVFGPERLPGIARTVGRTVGQIRREASQTFAALKDEIELEELDEIRSELQREREQLSKMTDLSDVDGAARRSQSAPPPRFDPQAT